MVRGKRRQQASLGSAPCLLDPHSQWPGLQENLKSGENTGLEVSESPKLDQTSLCAPVALFLYIPHVWGCKATESACSTLVSNTWL